MAIFFNKVTWYSKLFALIFFLLILPAWTFYIGMQYENTMNYIKNSGTDKTTQKQESVLNVNKENLAVAKSNVSGIAGKVTIKQNCTAQTNEKSCITKPYSTKLIIQNADGKIFTETVSEQDGKFFLLVPKGKYIIKNSSSPKIPGLVPVNIEVSESKITEVSLLFDNSIR